MKKYTICRKKDWDQIEAAKICEKMRPFHPDITAEAKVCYDDENLYVQQGFLPGILFQPGPDVRAISEY